MIAAAGLTPAWQRIMVFDRVTLGEVNRAARIVECISGKVTNTAIAARSLGGDVTAVLPIGPNVWQEVTRETAELNLACEFVPTAAPTRTCVTVIDRASGQVTELVEDAAPLAPSELAAFAKRLRRCWAKADILVFSGSLPRGTPAETYRDLLSECPIPIIADFRGPGLMAVLPLRPLLVKPNRAELEATLACSFRDDQGLIAGMEELCRRGAVWTLVSQGSAAIWLASQNEVYRFDPPIPDTVENPIGCGDALAGALAWALNNGVSVPEAVRLGVAAAQDNLRTLLPCRLDPDWVRRCAERIPAVRVR